MDIYNDAFYVENAFPFLEIDQLCKESIEVSFIFIVYSYLVFVL